MKLKMLFLAGTLCVFAACNKDDNNNDVSTQDQTFVLQASMSNHAETDLGTIAGSKASNASAKAYGQMMIMEHTDAQNKLATIAGNQKISVNLGDTLSAANIKLRDSLNSLTGRAFDTTYIKSQIRAHQMTAANFQTEISNGSNQQVKTFATENLPHILMHLDSANAIYTRIRQ